jgi:hypothetical protein
MENNSSLMEYQKTEIKKGYDRRKNSEKTEPIWKRDKDWREFYFIHFE